MAEVCVDDLPDRDQRVIAALKAALSWEHDNECASFKGVSCHDVRECNCWCSHVEAALRIMGAAL